MKPSRYNIYVAEGDHFIFFNTLSEHFFDVSTGNAETFRAIINNPDLYADDCPEFIDRMRQTGFILDDETDERALLLKKHEALTAPAEYHLMVLPTYQCNLRCWYCTQKHANVELTDETTSRILKNIDAAVSNPEIKSFMLSWFGGEPIMAYERVLSITRYAQRACNEKNIRFRAHITTNSTLLNRERIDALIEAGVVGFQITIDGDRATHDNVKRLPHKKSAYVTALRNIDYLARKISCSLRFNYTHENLHPDEIIADLTSLLSEEARHNIRFCLHKVWQEEDNDIDPKEVERLRALALKNGLRSDIQTTGFCYADKKHFNCVFPNGAVGKCDNHDMTTVPASLSENGSIHWPESAHYIHNAVLDESSICAHCTYLPFCWGPCASNRKAMLRNNGKLTCKFRKADEEVPRIIIDHCKNIDSSRISS